MTVPVHSPARAQETENKSALALAIEARGRKVQVVDISHLGLTLPGDKRLAKVAVRVNVKGELDVAVVDANRYVEGLAKGTEAAKDEDLTRDAKTPFALWNAFRSVDDNGQPTIMGAFPSPKWIRDNLDNDEIGALLNIYNDVQTRLSPWPYRFEDEHVEELAMLCADGADTEVPTALLAGVDREMIAQYFIIVACKLRKARSEKLAAEALLEAATATTDTEPALAEEEPAS